MWGEVGEEALHQIGPDGGASPPGPPPSLPSLSYLLGVAGAISREQRGGQVLFRAPHCRGLRRCESQVVGALHSVLIFSSWTLLSKQQTPADRSALTLDLPQCDPGSSAVVGLLSEAAHSPGRRSLPGLQRPAPLQWGPRAGNHPPHSAL